MFERVGLLNLAQDVAQHAAHRQSTIARNVANADTPGYKARDLTPFERTGDDGFRMRRTSALHLDAHADARPPQRLVRVAGAVDPNGNSVNLDEEVLRAVDSARTHDRAVTIYQNALQILRTSLGRGGR